MLDSIDYVGITRPVTAIFCILSQQRGAFEVFDREFFGQGVPEMGAGFGAAVVVAGDYAAGLHDLEVLDGLGNQALGLVAGLQASQKTISAEAW
jgi:hypothetical protein